MPYKNALEAFENALNFQSSTDVVIPYDQVANAFPSDQPHPYSVEQKMIDERKLEQWGSENGWKIKAAPELQGNNKPFSFPVRFIKVQA